MSRRLPSSIDTARDIVADKMSINGVTAANLYEIEWNNNSKWQ